ncbi:radical SAM protein [Fontimonas sp. SYSU GA230001]|uniref:radical SAM protein n=1 Tax=Fontimonas sp. SYSU GA230001 TaxID=3142450 RepID=UPI0032B529A1
MKLSLMFSARCNARCAHCSTSCGPHRTEALSREQIFGLMDQAAEASHGEPLRIGLTGGEPFLDFPLLLEIVAHGKALGADMGCVTNAYWATSDDKARAVLSELKDAGLNRLAISASRFHQMYVNRRRVERALNAGRQVGLPCGLKYVHLRSDPEDERTIDAWARAAGARHVEVFPVLPHLREGEVLPVDEYRRRPGLPTQRCPGMLTTVGWDGEAYTCCNPGAFNPLLSLGNAHVSPLRELHDGLYFGGTQQILREHGPIHFARAVQARGEGARLRRDYTSVCEMCTHIATDPVMAPIAAEVSEAFEVQQLSEILDRVVGPATATDIGGIPVTCEGRHSMKKSSGKKRSTPKISAAKAKKLKERRELSFMVFSDRGFRMRLLRNPKKVAAEFGLNFTDKDVEALLAARDDIKAYGEAVDTLVRLGKNVNDLWRDRNMIMVIDGLLDPGGW